MKSSGTEAFNSFPQLPEMRQGAGDLNARPAGTPGQPRRGTLSQGRVTGLISDLVGRRFYGKLTLHFEAGHIVCAKLEHSIKE